MNRENKYDHMILRAEDKAINWYPGHMARAKRRLMEQLSRVDVVVELCDARIPRASRNPELSELVKNKKRLLILNKADLAEEAATRAWLAYYRSQGMDCMSFDSAKGRAKDVVTRIEKAASEAVARMAAKGVKKTVRVMIVGVPNVGKSTFTNKVNGSSIAKTGDRPGVTRSNQWVRITPYLELLDTPGLLWPKLDNQDDARALAFVGTTESGGMVGNIMALVSAFFYAGVFYCSRLEGADTIDSMVLGNAMYMVLLPLMLTNQQVLSSPLQDWLLAGTYGLIGGFGAWMCFAKGIKTTPALQANFITMLEPVLAPVWTFLILGETITVWSLLGAVVVIGGILVYNTLQTKQEKTG